jgi:hypothetical protein
MTEERCSCCGARLKISPVERTWLRNRDTYQSWVREVFGKFDESDRWTVKHLMRCGWTQSNAYHRIKIMRRHGLVRLVHRGTRGGIRADGTSNSPDVFAITPKCITLIKEVL